MHLGNANDCGKQKIALTGHPLGIIEQIKLNLGDVEIV